MGFEPTVELPPHRFSRPAYSTAIAPLQIGPGPAVGPVLLPFFGDSGVWSISHSWGERMCLVEGNTLVASVLLGLGYQRLRKWDVVPVRGIDRSVVECLQSDSVICGHYRPATPPAPKLATEGRSSCSIWMLFRSSVRPIARS